MVTDLLPAIFENFAADLATFTVKLVRHENFSRWQRRS
jgi:hypothetical protein